MRSILAKSACTEIARRGLAEHLSPYYDKICEAEQAIDPFPSSGPCVVIAKHPFHGVPIGAAQLMVQRFTESV